MQVDLLCVHSSPTNGGPRRAAMAAITALEVLGPSFSTPPHPYPSTVVPNPSDDARHP